MFILPKEKYDLAASALQKVAINNLFARSVIEHKVTGEVYVDDLGNPSAFYVIHPYSMTLLFGAPGNTRFNEAFRAYALNTTQQRKDTEWMQAFPQAWDETFRNLFGEHLKTSAETGGVVHRGTIELNTRINFMFNLQRYAQRSQAAASPDIQIVRTDSTLFRAMKGSVVPIYFWNSEEDFLTNGVGFSLLYKGELASTAYASFIHDDKLELGIETIPELRGHGFAERVCAALIDYCLQHQLIPVWACRFENTGSYNLAQKLGFEPTAKIPYYRLPA